MSVKMFEPLMKKILETRCVLNLVFRPRHCKYLCFHNDVVALTTRLPQASSHKMKLRVLNWYFKTSEAQLKNNRSLENSIFNPDALLRPHMSGRRQKQGSRDLTDSVVTNL